MRIDQEERASKTRLGKLLLRLLHLVTVCDEGDVMLFEKIVYSKDDFTVEQSSCVCCRSSRLLSRKQVEAEMRRIYKAWLKVVVGLSYRRSRTNESQ